MLILGYKSRALSLSLVSAIVACVAERNPFLRFETNKAATHSSGGAEDNDSDADDMEDSGEDEEETAKLQLWYHPQSDILARLRALGAFAFARKQLLEKEMDKNSRQQQLKRGKRKDKEISHEESSGKDETYKLCEQFGLHHVSIPFLLVFLVPFVSIFGLTSSLSLSLLPPAAPPSLPPHISSPLPTLSKTTMTRCLELQKQLYQLSLNNFKKSKQNHQVSLVEFLNTFQPPDSAEELGLRQVSLLPSLSPPPPLSLRLTPGHGLVYRSC
jgi:hypothetical protein